MNAWCLKTRYISSVAQTKRTGETISIALTFISTSGILWFNKARYHSPDQELEELDTKMLSTSLEDILSKAESTLTTCTSMTS